MRLLIVLNQRTFKWFMTLLNDDVNGCLASDPVAQSGGGGRLVKDVLSVPRSLDRLTSCRSQAAPGKRVMPTTITGAGYRVSGFGVSAQSNGVGKAKENGCMPSNDGLRAAVATLITATLTKRRIALAGAGGDRTVPARPWLRPSAPHGAARRDHGDLSPQA